MAKRKPSVPADSRVTFFPKPKKVTKEGFALRWALLALGVGALNTFVLWDQRCVVVCLCLSTVVVGLAIY